MLGSLVKELLRKGRRPADVPELSTDPYYDVAQISRQIGAKAAALRAGGYLDYPVFVHLETIAVCNAACDFCPYPRLERKGTKMSDALIEKVIDDLTGIPPTLQFQFAPYKVSDPFLEPRLFDIIAHAESKLPGMRVSLITNGTALTERKIAQVRKIQRLGYLNVSLNYEDAEEYERVMKLPLARTLSRLDVLHRKHTEEAFAFPIRLTRVSGGKQTDERFIKFVRARYPAFKVMILQRNDWIGEVVTEGSLSEVPDAPCHRWFDLSVTATGRVAMCCMDGEAQYPKGDVNTQHALEIYNQPRLRELRRTLISRRSAAAPCNRCTYLTS